jgi:hypothetical protein
MRWIIAVPTLALVFGAAIYFHGGQIAPTDRDGRAVEHERNVPAEVDAHARVWSASDALFLQSLLRNTQPLDLSYLESRRRKTPLPVRLTGGVTWAQVTSQMLW